MRMIFKNWLMFIFLFFIYFSMLFRLTSALDESELPYWPPHFMPIDDITPIPTLEPIKLPTITKPDITKPEQFPTQCAKKNQGDANCDEKIDGLDYSIWFENQCPTSLILCSDNNFKADFNDDKEVNTIDYEIWKENRIKQLPPP